MISFDLSNLYAVDKKHGMSEKDVMDPMQGIGHYMDKIKARDQDFYKIVNDDETVEQVMKYAESVQGKYESVVVLGIGGSSLGTICLRDSLGHLFGKTEGPRLHVLDNIDPSFIAELEDVIDLSSTLFIVVTKSGGTPETLSEFFYFRAKVEAAGLKPQDHFVMITDPEKGLLRKIVNEESFTAFDVPPKVGGRFSVLTPVGLVPAALIGIDIRALVAGAREMRDLFLSEEVEENLPFQLASIQEWMDHRGKPMHVLFPYSQKLIKLADWYRQLLAESIGKAKTDSGRETHIGITPLYALGVTDQHSQNQLYNEGPNDKFFMFIRVGKMGPKLEIPNPYPDEPAVEYLKNVDFECLMKTEMKGTMQSLIQNDRPSMVIDIPEVNETTLGQLFMLFEASIAFLGEFYNINAFDQPGVELSKNLTKQMLMPS